MMSLLLQAGPLPEVDPGVAGEGLTNALKTGGILLAIVFGGMLAIYFLNLFLLPNLKGKAKAIAATILIGAAAAFGYLSINPKDWMGAIFAGLGSGLSAGKAWDLLPDKAKEKLKAPIEKKRDA